MPSDGPVASGPPDSDLSSIVMSWQRSATPIEAIERALYALADQVSGVIEEKGGTWEVAIYPKSISAHDETVAHRMRQEVIDQTLRVRIAERTDPIRNLVFAIAFSRSGIASDGAQQ